MKLKILTFSYNLTYIKIFIPWTGESLASTPLSEEGQVYSMKQESPNYWEIFIY